MGETNINSAAISILQSAGGGGESIKLKINQRKNELTLVDTATGQSAKLDIEIEIENDRAGAANGDATISRPHSVENTFQGLASQWKRETAHLSLAIKQVMHPAYQRIIGLGPVAIPLILRELQRERDHWFWALEAITGEKPAYSDGNIAEATQAWLQWGKEKHYL